MPINTSCLQGKLFISIWSMNSLPRNKDFILWSWQSTRSRMACWTSSSNMPVPAFSSPLWVYRPDNPFGKTWHTLRNDWESALPWYLQHHWHRALSDATSSNTKYDLLALQSLAYAAVSPSMCERLLPPTHDERRHRIPKERRPDNNHIRIKEKELPLLRPPIIFEVRDTTRQDYQSPVRE